MIKPTHSAATNPSCAARLSKGAPPTPEARRAASARLTSCSKGVNTLEATYTIDHNTARAPYSVGPNELGRHYQEDVGG